MGNNNLFNSLENLDVSKNNLNPLVSKVLRQDFINSTLNENTPKVSNLESKSSTPKVANNISSAVVKIEAYRNDNGSYNQLSQGSGFFIDSHGDLATAWHVIDNYPQIFVETANGHTYLADTKYIDRSNDLAVLHIEKNNSQFLNFGSPNLSYGQKLIAFGYPLNAKHLVSTQGYFKNYSFLDKIDPNLPLLPGESSNQNLLQADIKTLPGNSGGPIVNSAGEVVGIVDLSNDKNLTEAIPIYKLKN